MITFDPVLHVYQLGDRRLPSVTEILQALGIVRVYGSNTNNALRGKAVHEACCLYDSNLLDESETSPEVMCYVNSWKQFIASTKPTVEMSEQIVWSDEYEAAGTVDRVLKFPDTRIVVTELKTGSERDWHRLQSAMYCKLLEVNNYHVDDALLVYLKGDGKYKSVYLSEEDIAAGSHTLEAWKWLRKRKVF